MFAIFVTLLLLVAQVQSAVDVVPQINAVRLAGTKSIGQTLDQVLPAGAITIYVTNSPAVLYAIVSAEMRVASPVATLRNLTLPDSMWSGVILGDAIYFFGFDKVHRVDISGIKASQSYQWNLTTDVATMAYTRAALEAPLPDYAFSATVNGVQYGYFVSSFVSPTLGAREIIRLDPTKFAEGQNTATAISHVSSTLAFGAGSAGVNSAIFAFADEAADRTELHIWDIASESTTKRFFINKLSVPRQTILFDEASQLLWVAGQNTTVDSVGSKQLQPMLYRVNLTEVSHLTAYDGAECSVQCTGAVNFMQLSIYNERVNAIGLDAAAGTVFVALFDGFHGSVIRVNTESLLVDAPELVFTPTYQDPLVISVDPDTRFIFVGLVFDVVSFQYPTICISGCGYESPSSPPSSTSTPQIAPQVAQSNPTGMTEPMVAQRPPSDAVAGVALGRVQAITAAFGLLLILLFVS